MKGSRRNFLKAVGALEVRDGKVAIPEGPGWGVTINPKWPAAAKHDISER